MYGAQAAVHRRLGHASGVRESSRRRSCRRRSAWWTNRAPVRGRATSFSSIRSPCRRTRPPCGSWSRPRARGARTIAFTKARRITELLHQWLVKEAPELASKVAPYRAGYLPEERRAIEKKLFAGQLLAVLSTSALELGIDVGGLDVCVLVGYPGSRTSTWQRVGRVGREGNDALVVLIAMPDALDQYPVAHPDMLFDGAFERAVLDPWNPAVAGSAPRVRRRRRAALRRRGRGLRRAGTGDRRRTRGEGSARA